MKYEQNLIGFALALVVVLAGCGIAYGLLWVWFKIRSQNILPPPDPSCARDCFNAGMERK